MENLNLVVLRALMTKRGWYGMHHIVQVDTFQSSEYRQLFGLIKLMHDGTESDISPDALAADIEATFQTNEEQRFKLLDMVQLLEETAELPEDQLMKLVTKFLQRSIGYSLGEYIANHAEQESFDANVMADLAARAVDVSDRVNSSVTNLFEEDLSGAPDSKPVRLGLGLSRKLDSSLRGGIGPGELGLYLAGPAVGKTSLLVQSGATHAARGGRVLHITLEINTRKVIERYDQAWTGLTHDAGQTPEGQAKTQRCREVVQAGGGSVHIADWAYMPVTSNDVGALVRKMRGQGVGIDLVIIDYLGLMTPNKNPGKEYRQQFSAIGKEMRSLARNLEMPVLSAWQVNREGSKKDLLGKEDISESFDIVMIADIIIGLNSNQVMSNFKRMKLNIIKQRESTDRCIAEVYCDLDSMTIRDITAEDHFEEARKITAGVAEPATDAAGVALRPSAETPGGQSGVASTGAVPPAQGYSTSQSNASSRAG